ncbi:MAG: hypothetical protein ACYC65_11155 [Candidatus Limnocylindrales bacterium]
MARKIGKIALVVVIVLVAMTIFGFVLKLAGYTPPPDPTPSPPPHVISGTFSLFDNGTVANDCVGTEGTWHDVRPGATVKVYEGDGSASRYPLSPSLGEGSLGEGRVTNFEEACSYDFTIGVPTADEYSIKYPGGLLLHYTFAELESMHWKVAPDCCTWRPAN